MHGYYYMNNDCMHALRPLMCALIIEQSMYQYSAVSGPPGPCNHNKYSYSCCLYHAVYTVFLFSILMNIVIQV